MTELKGLKGQREQERRGCRAQTVGKDRRRRRPRSQPRRRGQRSDQEGSVRVPGEFVAGKTRVYWFSAGGVRQ